MRTLKQTHLLIPLVAVLALILATMACSGGATATEQAPAVDQPTAQSGQVGVDSVTLYRDNGSGEAGDVVQSFTPADHKMHFEVKTTGLLSPGSKVKWVFIGVDTTEGKDLQITTVETDVLVANTLTATLTLDRDWPVGRYKADVSINGQPLTTVNYTVEGDQSAVPTLQGLPGVESTAMYRDDGNGKPGEQVQGFTPTDRKIHFEVRLTDIVPIGTVVKWVFTAVDTTDGKNLEFQTIEIPLETSGNSLFSNLELPNDWPTGTYKADIYVNGDLLTTIDYTIQ